jgi:hypothetical protein
MELGGVVSLQSHNALQTINDFGLPRTNLSRGQNKYQKGQNELLHGTKGTFFW